MENLKKPAIKKIKLKGRRNQFSDLSCLLMIRIICSSKQNRGIRKCLRTRFSHVSQI